MAATTVTTLLDTDVLIDVLRQHPAAKEWLTHEADTNIVIHGVVAMEIISGAGDKQDLRRTQTFLSRFTLAWPTAAEFEYAFQLLAENRLATGVGIPDCLIAATAITRSWRLYTFNLKHYRHFAGIQVVSPYSR
ncbi:MAG: type II toxin-antitoxin system VapC family toxin [Anaerolineae bacterium]|nr:PIN domain-containing protein [Anaerolineales bacterium]MCQ3980158.1 type II toxin-antitoxin system VapC family toxin [Anaerolineae bacterium]